MKRTLIIILVVATIVGLIAWRKLKSNVDDRNYRTAPAEKGDLAETVKATGTIAPVNKVDVGSQVSGRIVKLYVDFNSQVKKGDILAQIDPEPYKARVAQDKAMLRRAYADIAQSRERIDLAEKQLQRIKDLNEGGFVSQQDLDVSLSNRNTLNAQLRLSQATAAQAKAALQLSETDLGYTTITAPVDGIVVARMVNEGQTVVASLNVQIIFTIATDLKKIQVEAAVPEADIGRIKVDMPVIFSVDSFPNETFTGTVTQIRIAATTVQNVVTYPVIITAENPEEKLYPGMTADVSVEVKNLKDVLMIPNSALRFKPLPENPYDEEEAGAASEEEPLPPGWRKAWIESPEGPKPVPVKVGISDGIHTQILEGDLKEGQEVITGIYEETDGKEMNNPFAPKFPTKKKPSNPHR